MTIAPAARTARRQRHRPTDADAAAIAAVYTAARTLGLPSVRDRLEEQLASAHREQLTYAAFLADILGAECDDRTHRRANAGCATPVSHAQNGWKNSRLTPTRPSTPPSSDN